MAKTILVHPEGIDCGCQIDLSDPDMASIIFCAKHMATDEMIGVLNSIRIPTDVNAAAATAIQNVLAKAKRSEK